jgi:hypothetical protein
VSDLLDSIHDCFYDAIGKSLPDSDLATIAIIIPDEILNIGNEWGYYDTVFREKLFLWAKGFNK